MKSLFRDDRIFVTGHCGLVGSAILRRLQADGYEHLVSRTRSELDLRDSVAIGAFFEAERPDVVVLAAAKVGGILPNDAYPGDFILDNLRIEVNVVDAAHRVGVRRLLFLGSSCVYPRMAEQPISEDSLPDVVGFEGNIVFDTLKPDGTRRKLLDVSKNQACVEARPSRRGIFASQPSPRILEHVATTTHSA